MTKSIYILLLFLVWQYSAQHNKKKSEPVYFYDTENILKKQERSTTIFYSTSIPVFTVWPDSTPRKISRKGYLLLHFYNDDNGYKKDTSFNKPATFLNSLDYFDYVWLKKEKNLNQFWDYSMYEFGGREDTLEIYLIHKIPDTDSIKLEQVHRFYIPNREG